MLIIIKDIVKISSWMIIRKIKIILTKIMMIHSIRATMMIKVTGLIQASIKDIGMLIINGLIQVELMRITIKDRIKISN